MSKYYYPEERIAVVAMGGIFPDAKDTSSLWSNILSKKISVREISDDVPDIDLFYDPEVFGKHTKNDKTYTKIAAVPDKINYIELCSRFKIPPAVAEHMDPNQYAAIYSVDQALRQLKSSLPKEKTAVILSIGSPGRRYIDLNRRVYFSIIENRLRNHPEIKGSPEYSRLEAILDELSAEVKSNTLAVTEDTAPGYLQNITASRISNIFDLWGPSYVLDAACASSLASTIEGVVGLLNHEYDAVITGGVEVTLNEHNFIAFSGINALSPDGSYPFDSRANGFVVGLGGGVLVLKRLSDALRDNDNIISIISGYGRGSDGKGKYIAAPSEQGQIRVIQSACEMANYTADTIELIEAHGTGTIVGDVVEMEALKNAFSNLGVNRENFCGVGSIKSNIGHLRNAAGGAGLIKASMALKNRILPPSANVQSINPKLGLEGSPFYILQDSRPWEGTGQHPRRANVSAYGFGGADFHICLEEYRAEFVPKNYPVSKPGRFERKPGIYDQGRSEKKPSRDKPVMNVFFSADNFDELKEEYLEFVENTKNIKNTNNIENTNNKENTRNTENMNSTESTNSTESIDNIEYDAARTHEFKRACFLNNSSVSVSREWRLAISCTSINDLEEKWGKFEEFIAKGDLENSRHLKLKGIYFGMGRGYTSEQIAFMFPGQASQYPNMLSSIYENFSMIKSFYMQIDAVWQSRYGYSVLPLIFGSEEELKARLKDTVNTHPAMFISSMALFKLLSESGVKADYMIGHSLGEITSLFASGMLDLKSAVRLIGSRGFAFDSIPENQRGKMLSIKLSRERVSKILENNDFHISISNINSPQQVVVGGVEEEIDKLKTYLDGNNIKYITLNVSHAFHTELVQEAADRFYSDIRNVKFSPPTAKLMCCNEVDLYPTKGDELDKVPNMLKEQIISPVNFVDSILKLYEEGVRIFIETGPSSVLTNLVEKILDGKDIRVVASNNKNKDSIETFYHTLAELFVCGIDISEVPEDSILGIYDKENADVEDSDKESIDQVSIDAESVDADSSFNEMSLQNASREYQNSQFYKEENLKNDLENNKESMTGIYKEKESIVYSGVSIGLPGSFKKAFSDDNFDIIFEGKNLIEKLTNQEQESILDLNITRLLKTENTTTLKEIKSINEVIQFAGKFGQMDMMNDYLIDEGMLEQMTLTVCAGIAAGYEALADAGIPLISEKKAGGKYLSNRLVLPEDMRDNTGIIFANGLWPLESVIDEVSRYVASKFGSRTRNDLINFYNDVITNISDETTKRKLTDWFTLHYSRLLDSGNEGEIYKFNHHFMNLLSSQANNRLAQLIAASGPNFYVGAACSSTASAITIAEDIIRAGHADRMIVIGADISSTPNLLPWFGAGFLSMGSLTDSADLFQAAVPFDRRRNGMILGSGAVGLLLEKERDVQRRGMNGICRILGSHAFNTAGHQSRIDTDKHAVELDRFIKKMENEYRLDRDKLASEAVYCSHETFSPRKGGCAETEKIALERVFGENFKKLKVINTKGFTGHTMGASIEDAVSAKALQYQRIPPIANYKEADPILEGLNLSSGGSYEFKYILKSVIGFGAQGNYQLLQGIAEGDDRIINKDIYNQWLNKITEESNTELKYRGRILTAEGENEHSSTGYTGEADKYSANISRDGRKEVAASNSAAYVDTTFDNAAFGNSDNTSSANINATIKSSIESQEDKGADSLEDKIYQIFSEITKYPPEMLEKDMELEADLGIDTVKQATIFSMIGEEFKISVDRVEELSQHKTIGALLAFVKNNRTDQAGKNDIDQQDIKKEVLELISQITKYPVEMLEMDMELEADLGIDTIKQATIFSELGEKYKLDETLGSSAAQYKTIESIVNMIGESFEKSSAEPVVKPAVENYNDVLQNDVLQDDSPGKVVSNKDSYEKNIEITSTEISNTDVSNIEIINTDIENTDISNKDISNVNISITEDDKIDRELCLQIPVFKEKEITSSDYALKDKNVWVIGDDTEKVKKTIVDFNDITDHVEGFVFDDSMELEDLTKKIFNFVKKPVDIIVDISCSEKDIDFDKIAGTEEESKFFLNSEARFIFYKKLSELLTEPELKIVCLVSIDGSHGHSVDNKDKFNPFPGALCGFYKGLRKEWGKSSIKIVDIGPQINFAIKDKKSDTGVTDILLDELKDSSADYEIGYKDGKRVVLKLDYLDRQKLEGTLLPESPHFVVTGGGSGIAAEIIRGISQKMPATFTILGRTVLPENIKELSQLSKRELKEKRFEILESLKESGKRPS
ncbi:MAG: beta-ketoacyl synthase N-terminal-like domain-containing protein, partial [Halanaerobiales bacterium]